MIPLSTLDNLTEEELALLILIINGWHEKREMTEKGELVFEWEPEIIKSFKIEKVRAKVLAVKDKIKEENMSIWESLKNKLA